MSWPLEPAAGEQRPRRRTMTPGAAVRGRAGPGVREDPRARQSYGGARCAAAPAGRRACAPSSARAEPRPRDTNPDTHIPATPLSAEQTHDPVLPGRGWQGRA